MRINVLYPLALVVYALILVPNTLAQGIHLPPHQRVVLKNGLTVLLLEKHEASFVSLTAIVKTGSTADPIGQEGLASVTAGMLRQGTRNESAEEFASDLDFIGAPFDSEVNPDYTRISEDLLAKDLESGLRLFSDALQHPSFSPAEVTKYLSRSLDAVKSNKDEAQSAINTYFESYLFDGHPYGRPVSGDEISLKHITASEIGGFHNKYYAPGNTILAVAGDFKSAEMLAKVENAFGAWPAKPAPGVSIAQLRAGKEDRLLLIDKPDSTETFFRIGGIGTTANDPDRVAIYLVNTIFGASFSSMLNQALRVESGLTYGARSRFVQRTAPGSFAISSYTRNETTARAIDLALAVLQKLHKDSVTQEQLDSARSYIKGQYPPEIETSAQLASVIGINEFYGLDDSEVNQFESRLDAVTPEVARRVIKEHFPSDNLVFVLIGKASEIGPEVKKYAKRQDAREIADPGFWPPRATEGVASKK